MSLADADPAGGALGSLNQEDVVQTPAYILIIGSLIEDLILGLSVPCALRAGELGDLL